MLQDKDTNKVYVSHWLREVHPDFFNELMELFGKVGIECDLLPHSNDYWARDYMPFQLDDHTFIKYWYHPDYLQETPCDRATITDSVKTMRLLGLPFKGTKIILDGGNIIPCGDYIIMTDKVFSENGVKNNDPSFIKKLETIFDSPIVFIPWHQTGGDCYGHADGFVRYIGKNKILMSNIQETDKNQAVQIKNILESKGYEVVTLKYEDKVNTTHHEYNWAYINFLQVANKIILPKFNIQEDDVAMQYIHACYPECDVFQIKMNEVVREGGALHCLTWNIKS